jgi:cytochrome c biogenesis protein CcdA
LEIGGLRGLVPRASRIAILIIVSLAVSSPRPTVSCSTDALRLYVVSCDGCEGYRERVEVLRRTLPEATITFYEIEEGGNARRFNEISKAVRETLYMPLVGVFVDDALVSIASGGFSPEGWVEAVEGSAEVVTLYIAGEGGQAGLKKTIVDRDTVNTVSMLFVEEEVGFPEEDLGKLVFIVASAALVDAINPCCVGVFTVLLTLVFYGVGKRAVLGVGLAFSLGLFAAYLLLGLGLGRVFRQIPDVKYLVSALAIILGATRLLDASGWRVKHLPGVLSGRVTRMIEGVTTPRSGLVAGAATGLLLLPCSSAPYFIVINMIADKPSILGLALLIFYNLIIVAPFIALTMIVYGLVFSTMELKQWSLESRRWVNALIGVILMALGVVNLLL